MSDYRKSLLAVGILCVVCSLLITAAYSGLKGYQLRNMNLDRQKNLLRSVGLIDDQRKYLAEHQALAQINQAWPQPIFFARSHFFPYNLVSCAGTLEMR